MSTEQMDDPNLRCGYVAVIGAPNAGKSTLVNYLVGAKVTIVSHKVQTTRNRILGILTNEFEDLKSQIVLMDTPGLFDPKTRLDRAMVGAAWSGAEEADIVLYLYDVRKNFPNEDDVRIIKTLNQKQYKNVWLVLNKIDEIKRDELLEITKTLNEQYEFQKTFMISALKGDGVKSLLNEITKNLPQNPWFFEEDQMTDLPMRLLAAEITREKIFNYLHEELPYSITVETEEWEEFDDGSLRVRQVIHVERDSQKGIVLGKGGVMLKRIGSESRHEMKQILEKNVHLKLFVRVSDGWRNDPVYFQTWGLDENA
jgi:GTP-binding protein Era